MYADLKAAGTTPDCSERLKRRQRNGAKSSAHSFNGHVGIGFVEHCLLSKPLTAEATSSGETGWKPGNTQLVSTNSGGAVSEVDALISATFLWKKLWKATAVMPASAGGQPCPSSLSMDCHTCLGVERCCVTSDFLNHNHNHKHICKAP